MQNGRKNFETSGILPGPQILGNVPREEGDECELWRIPALTGNNIHGINSGRVCFTYSVHRDGVHVHSDLDSDYGIRRLWKNRNAAKAVEKARRKLASYGASIGLDELMADGWTVG